MSALAALRAAHERLAAGEPIRILVGHRLHSAMEIEPAQPFLAGLRVTLQADIERQIAALTPPDNPPAAPGAIAGAA